MKKIIKFPLSKYFIHSLSAIILSSAVFIACNKESTNVATDTTLSAASKSSLSIQAATEWFGNYIKSADISKNSRYKNIQPIWDKAIINEEAIEVPFAIDGKFQIPKTGEGLSLVGKERLIIYSDSNKMKALIMDILPNQNFKGLMKDIDAFRFKKASFNGNINLFELNSDAIRGYEITEGKTVKFNNLIEVKDNSASDPTKTSFRCSSFTTTYLIYQMVSWTGPSGEHYVVEGQVLGVGTSTTYSADCFGQPVVSSNSSNSGYGGGSSWNPGSGSDGRPSVSCLSFSFNRNNVKQYRFDGSVVSGLASRLSGIKIPVGGDYSPNNIFIPDFTFLIPAFVDLPSSNAAYAVSQARGSTINEYANYSTATQSQVENSFFNYLAYQCSQIGMAYSGGRSLATFDRGNIFYDIPTVQVVYYENNFGDSIGGSQGCDK